MEQFGKYALDSKIGTGGMAEVFLARTTVAQLVDWCLHTPEDGLTTRRSVEQRLALARANKALLGK